MNRVCSTYRAGAVFTVIIAGLLIAANARDFTPLAAGRPRPLDFDEYWDGEIVRQKREVPLASRTVKAVEVKGRKSGFKIYDVEIPALSKTPVRGILTIPVGATVKSLPVVMRFGGAGSKSSGEDYLVHRLNCSPGALLV